MEQFASIYIKYVDLGVEMNDKWVHQGWIVWRGCDIDGNKILESSFSIILIHFNSRIENYVHWNKVVFLKNIWCIDIFFFFWVKENLSLNLNCFNLNSLDIQLRLSNQQIQNHFHYRKKKLMLKLWIKILWWPQLHYNPFHLTN
jgi:hypothetical protein